MRHAALALLATIATLSVACASTPSSAPVSPLENESTHATAPKKAKALPVSHVIAAAPESAPDETMQPVATPDVSYEDAMKAAESEISDEGILISECNVVGGSMAMSCALDGAATVKFVVQQGVVKGVTVETEPRQPRVAKCMRAAIADVTFRAVKAPTGCVRTFKMSK